ncbi:hypothetical protein [uncultured Maricaulis sp.]|uniref:hypothetical protein n=1 Tax=uncultured Maricaulis sp. TaxID=174710 RepID=UPI0030DA82FC|tara:strand:- start:13498 stop:14091 length:594 start_codon:yes stop_codon:yes gene_type:complete
MRKITLFLAAASVLSACATTQSPGSMPPHSHPSPPPPRAVDTVEPATNMCQVAGLAEQRLGMLEEIHRYRETIQVDPGRSASVADTQTQELIAAFETDLDASYRFATASCRTYNRCLEENRFDEARCQDTARLWHEGQDRFHDLSLQLAAVRERIASGCTSCAAPGTAPQERPYQHSHESRQSDDLLGSVFSTGGHR